MKYSSFALSLTISFSLATAPALATIDTSRIGVAAGVIPQAIKESTNQKDEVLSIGANLITNEIIKTGVAGRTQILFLDGSSMNIGPSSHIILDSFVFDPSTLKGEIFTQIKQGSMRFIGGALSKTADQVKVITDNATIGIRGGIAHFTYDANQGVKAQLIHGTMTVTTAQGIFETSRIGTEIIAPPAGDVVSRIISAEEAKQELDKEAEQAQEEEQRQEKAETYQIQQNAEIDEDVKKEEEEKVEAKGAETIVLEGKKKEDATEETTAAETTEVNKSDVLDTEVEKQEARKSLSEQFSEEAFIKAEEEASIDNSANSAKIDFSGENKPLSLPVNQLSEEAVKSREAFEATKLDEIIKKSNTQEITKNLQDEISDIVQDEIEKEIEKAADFGVIGTSGPLSDPISLRGYSGGAKTYKFVTTTDENTGQPFTFLDFESQLQNALGISSSLYNIPLSTTDETNFRMIINQDKEKIELSGDFRSQIDDSSISINQAELATSRLINVNEFTFQGTASITEQYLDDKGEVIIETHSVSIDGMATSPSNSIATSSPSDLRKCKCDFLATGIWQTSIISASTGNTLNIYQHWVAGDVLKSDQMPASGTARFAGHAIGQVFDNGISRSAMGNVGIAYNFGTEVGTFTLSDFDQKVSGTVNIGRNVGSLTGGLPTGQYDGSGSVAVSGESSPSALFVAGAFYQDAGGSLAGTAGKFDVITGDDGFYSASGVYMAE